MKIVFCTTCKHRLAHLKLTLPKNLIDNPRSEFVVLDYGDERHLAQFIKTNSSRLHVYRFEAEKFHMAHAKNMAARLAIKLGADILVTLDADNFTGPGFEEFIENAFENESGIFLCPLAVGKGHHSLCIKPRGVAGRLVIRAQEFLKMGGYDEKFDTWKGEDVDLVARLRRTGFRPRPIPQQFLNAITHHAGLRFKEYPHASEHQRPSVVKAIMEEKHRVVNYGKIGCGTVTAMDGSTLTLEPVPTRVFGVGWQRTGTTSLAFAFMKLGFDTFHWPRNDIARDIWDEMLANGNSGSPTLERYYALCDSPIPILVARLDLAYPNSKFVLTIRDENDWLRSVQWLFSNENSQPLSQRLNLAMYGRVNFNKKTMLRAYREHNRQVKKYFEDRPDDLFILNTDKPDFSALAKFLGQPAPNVPYPHKNRSGTPRLPWWKRAWGRIRGWFSGR